MDIRYLLSCPIDCSKVVLHQSEADALAQKRLCSVPGSPAGHPARVGDRCNTRFSPHRLPAEVFGSRPFTWGPGNLYGAARILSLQAAQRIPSDPLCRIQHFALHLQLWSICTHS
jgi:hypothetical protein